MGIVSRGFSGRRREHDPSLPPGQYLTEDFPVLSAGPTPRVPTEEWQFRSPRSPAGTVGLGHLMALPAEEVTVDLHCVTRWSKLATPWRACQLDTLLADVETTADYVLAHAYGGYTTNLPWPTCSTARRGSPTGTTARTSCRPTAARPGCSCRTSTSGRARSGCAGSRCATTTTQGSGRPPATTTTGTRGASSATGASELARRDRAVPARREPTARTLVLDVPGWPGHDAGQHVDVRLTAPDGYTAARSYSIASAATVDGGADRRATRRRRGVAVPQRVVGRRRLEVRGPLGGWFVWRPEQRERAAAGRRVGLVPLMAMLRTQAATGVGTPMRLLYSVREPGAALHCAELEALAGADGGQT